MMHSTSGPERYVLTPADLTVLADQIAGIRRALDKVEDALWENPEADVDADAVAKAARILRRLRDRLCPGTPLPSDN